MEKEVYFKRDNFILYHDDCRDILHLLEPGSVDMIFSDPPYRLSNDGITCKAGKVVSVNKGKWDKSQGFDEDYKFTYKWINLCKKLLKQDGTLWISGTLHNIFQVGYALQSQGFQILNEIVWYKPNAPPNLSCRYFAHAHESLIWAKKSKDSKHLFNYQLMKSWEDKISPKDKQMRSIWQIPFTPLSEKKFGKHPTQKPLELLRRVVLASSKKGDLILDPFSGSGTTGITANKFGRKYIGVEIEKDFCDLTVKRFKGLFENFP